ncbi:MAG TPA: glutamate synthase large subunit, partial [Desulfopila sp.]|nr:glutamate synthase large subunit [Desulfopila sp.]
MTLYDINDSRDNCGFGLIAHMSGKPSHRIVRTGIYGLSRMSHRGGIAADGRTGDGCGILLSRPDSFFKAVALENGWSLGSRYGVGMVFLPRQQTRRKTAVQVMEEELQKETLTVDGWREVPINIEVLGELAASTLPHIAQVFVSGPSGWGAKDLERRLYMVRRRIEKRLQDDDFYVVSLSGVVTIYKGLCRPEDLNVFYPDLADLRMQSSICLFHQRFSTNTLP